MLYWIIFIILIGFAVGVYAVICWRSHRLLGRPFNAGSTIPTDAFRIVVLGDSLTHGTMSHNWLVDLQAEFGEGYAFVNVGTNGDLAWNALQKVDQVIDCKPDIVAVFIGGNDVLASLSPIWANSFIQRKKLPQMPTADWYRQNLEQIISSLQAKTKAKLVLFTLTLFGEELESVPNQHMQAYSQIVLEAAEKFQVPVLPVHQNLRTLLTTRQSKSRYKPNPATDQAQYRQLMRGALIRYHFLFQSWDKISAKRGYMLQTDGVHLNSQAAGVIQQAFSQWIGSQYSVGQCESYHE